MNKPDRPGMFWRFSAFEIALFALIPLGSADGSRAVRLEWALPVVGLGRVETEFFGRFDLNDPRVLNEQLNRAEAERSDVLRDDPEPIRRRFRTG